MDLEALFRDSLDAIVILDLQGRFTELNPRAEALAGQPRELLLGKHFSALSALSPDFSTSWRDQFERILRSGPAEPILLELRPLEGGPLWLECHPSVLRDGAANVGLQVVCRDVSKRILAERSRNGLLERLREVQRIEAVGRLVAGVAHDFNNLLTTIDGNTQLCQIDLGSEHDSMQLLDEIREAVRRATQLTRQLLAFSRLQVLEPEVVDLGQALHRTLKLLRRLIGENIHFEPVAVTPGCLVFADTIQVDQLLAHLAVLAREAMPDGGSLNLSLGQVHRRSAVAELPPGHLKTPPGQYCELQVQLAPCEIALDLRPLGRSAEDVGLGLGAVQEIVVSLGGYVEACVSEAVGTIRLGLPLCQETADLAPREVLPRGDETIVLIEDDLNLRSMTLRLLDRLGYQVLAAEDGEQALRLIDERGFAPALVVSDVVLPGLPGPEIVAGLRQRLPGLRVVFTSGYPDEIIARYGTFGPNARFLAKPFAPAEIARAVREALDEVR